MSIGSLIDSFWKWLGRWSDIGGIIALLGFFFGFTSIEQCLEKKRASPADGPLPIHSIKSDSASPIKTEKFIRFPLQRDPVSIPELILEIFNIQIQPFGFFEYSSALFTNKKLPIEWETGGTEKSLLSKKYPSDMASDTIEDHDSIVISRSGKARILFGGKLLYMLNKNEKSPKEFFWDIEIGTTGTEHYSGARLGPLFLQLRPGKGCGGRDPSPSSSCYFDPIPELQSAGFIAQKLCAMSRFDHEDWSIIYKLQGKGSKEIYMIHSAYVSRVFDQSTLLFLFFPEQSADNSPCEKLETYSKRKQDKEERYYEHLREQMDDHWFNILGRTGLHHDQE